jgi:hypothetical protein
MSLDVYLEGPATQESCTCMTCWNTHKRENREVLFAKNITHNLNKMAEVAGIYSELWHPEEIGITKAAQLIVPLTAGLAELRKNTEKFKNCAPANHWGTYPELVSFVESYLNACVENPEARVKVSA